ncbi:MAG: nickel transporter [Burkholderiales bacterium]|nr:nickel transporter [Burkholderiales bacterium]
MDLPRDFFALGLIVILLGIRHGFDADHLATIDGLTRINADRRFSRYCGLLFSLGHGAVVMAIALAVSTIAGRWQVPQWLESFGSGTSIFFLMLLGVLNLHAVFFSVHAHPVGIRGKHFARHAASPGIVFLIGALFAISFDTISQAALFSLTASRQGGWENALFMGLLFMSGMLFTDGLNGLWISRLIRRSDQTAHFASKSMTLVVGSSSLLVAIFGMMRLAFPGLDLWSEGKSLAFGLLLIALVAGSYAFTQRVARRIS